MKLKKLLNNVKILEIQGSTDIEVVKITEDSRKVKKNNLFVAIEGLESDGHDYITNAIDNGAAALVTEKNLRLDKKKRNITIIKVRNSRKTLAILAANFYKNPAKKLRLVGITGTNGKTTTCEFTYQLLNRSGKKVGLITTISAKFEDNEEGTGLHITTPNTLVLHKLLAKMLKNNCEYVVIETTSHGIDQHRTWGLDFEICAITNITPEHLDYHKTFDNYLKTKAEIFKQSKNIVLNNSDPSLTQLKKLVPKNRPLTIVKTNKIKVPKAFEHKFPGEYNRENAMLAITIVTELLGNISLAPLSNIPNVRGRLEFIENDRLFNIVIDFAHDSVALKKVLGVCRSIVKNNLILVFGCAGLRDKSKRSKMGGLSIKLADKVVITAEDPRTERLEDINKKIELGAIKSGGIKDKDYFIIEDRQQAINFAINKLANQMSIQI